MRGGTRLRVLALWSGILALGAGWGLVPSTVQAAKTDVVILGNDDHITGEIKSLERGRLKLKTDAADNLLIQWTDIKRVTSSASFEVEVRSGRRYFGHFDPIDAARTLHVVGFLDSLTLDFDDVVYIVPIKSTFLSRLDGSVDFGLSFTQANNLLQWSVSGEVKYRAPQYFSRISVSSTISDQKDVKRTSRQDFELRTTRFFRSGVSSNFVYGMMHNDELGVSLRLSLSGSGGTYWIKSNSVLWGGSVGLSVTSEQATNDGDFKEQLELPLNMEFETFTYHTPKRDVTASVSVIPSLTVKDRVRTELNIKGKYEIVKDFYVSLSALNSTDNKPPESAQAKSDLTLSFNVGFTF
jgi:hypothetical protein